MKTKNTFYILTLTFLLLTGGSKNNTNTPETSTTPETTTQTQETPSSSIAEGVDGVDMIPLEDAKAIALEHAGLTEEEVTFIKSDLDKDFDDHNYDIEFYTEDRLEYDYEIDAYTGRILGYDLDGHDLSGSNAQGNGAANAPAANVDDTSANTDDNTTNSNGNATIGNDGNMATASISEEDAKKFALEQVPGATEEDFLEFGRDYDNGILRYEVEILYDGKEYSFDIDARDGSILEWDKY